MSQKKEMLWISAARGVALACTIGIAAHVLSAQSAQRGLRIIVIEGENAVNVVQQRTAVAPVVEVRDRNDQPVAGAVVRFAIRGGKATFGGPNTVTVTTNSAGRAAVSTLTPTGSGTLQINATATFQGQTASVTIAQTNVMTASAASAAAAGAGASGAGAGGSGAAAGAAGGGGLSATTIAIVGGAVAGGAIVTKKIVDNNAGSLYRGSYSGTSNNAFIPSLSFCTRTISHSGTVEVEMEVDSNGGVHGEGRANGTTQMTSFTGPGICQITTAVQTHGDFGPMTGTKDAMAWTSGHAGLLGYFVTYDFKGALNGNTIVGTFTLTGTGSDGVDRGVFPVTLQKQ